MQIVLCFFSALLLSYQAFSQEQFKVIKTNPQKNRAIVEMSPGKRPNTGDKYSYSGGEFAKTCDLSVVQVNESTMVLDYSHCEDKDQIKPGQTLSLTWTQGASEGGVATESPPSEGLPSKNESWYTLWGFGLSAGPRYSGGEAGNINDFDNLPGVRRSTVNYDLLGFYWPTSDHRSMYGVVMNMISDQFEDGFTTFSFSQALISFSYHSFLGVNIGDGWFWRGDIGLASFRAIGFWFLRG